MCTIAFIPKNGQYYFASLRDESPKRPAALVPAFIYANNTRCLAPVDPLGGGTWVGINEYRCVIILMNGGCKNHAKKSKYAVSRGAIVKKLLADTRPVIGWNLMNLINVEPFTLIVWADEQLFQLVWNGRKKQTLHLSKTETHIWSSATLYSYKAQNYRANLFKNWIVRQSIISQLSLLDFFKMYDDPLNGFFINRNGLVKTLSYTFMATTIDNTVIVSYHDCISSQYHTSKISILTNNQLCLC